jgi:ferrous iron transport protein B
MRDRRTRRDVPVRRLQVALAGNPNVGKSSLFNHLTGSRQHVANWPGKTVERHVGTCHLEGVEVELVDLPGTYSLAGTTPEEQVAERALLDPGIDAVVVVLDSTNLERNLYLAAQIAELGRPLVLALNMTDVAARDGTLVDDAVLAVALDAPVVRTVGRTGQGLEQLRVALAEVTAHRARPPDVRPPDVRPPDVRPPDVRPPDPAATIDVDAAASR